MVNFWPKNLVLKNSASPFEIIEEAKKDWFEKSQGLIRLEIHPLGNRDGLSHYAISALHIPTDRSTTLFELSHREGAVYPIKIKPRPDPIPNSLRKTYYQPGFGEIKPEFQGRLVENKLVAQNPFEFTNNLSEVLTSDETTAEILSLTIPASEFQIPDDSEGYQNGSHNE